MKSQPTSIFIFLLLPVLVNTTNAQWTLVTTDLPYNSQAAYATDQVAFLVGHNVTSLPQINAYVSKSTDGGQTFSTTLTKADADYTAIHFVNEQLGFIAGDHNFNAVVLRTTNGGENWETTMLAAFPPSFQDIYFINEDVGFLVGGYGMDLIFKTENGGDSWENITFSDGPNFSSISFVDDSIGFVSSVFGDIYKTINQGESWNVLPFLPPIDQIYDMHFITETNSLVTDNDGVIYRTENGGDDWIEINLPGVDTTDRVHFHFVNDITGFIMTYTDDERKLFQTVDAGETWIEIFHVDDPFFWTFMAFSPTNTNALLGGSNSLYVNTNAEELVETSSLRPAIKELSSFDIFPNPANDEIDLSLAFYSALPLRINLLDIIGTVYESRHFETSELHTTLMLDQRAPGVYVVQVVTDNGVAVKSFVKR